MSEDLNSMTPEEAKKKGYKWSGAAGYYKPTKKEATEAPKKTKIVVTKDKFGNYTQDSDVKKDQVYVIQYKGNIYKTFDPKIIPANLKRAIEKDSRQQAQVPSQEYIDAASEYLLRKSGHTPPAILSKPGETKEQVRAPYADPNIRYKLTDMEKARLITDKMYDSATPSEKAAIHAHTAFSGRGVDYIVSGIFPGGKTSEDIAKEKLAETFLHRNEKGYSLKVAKETIFGSAPGILGTSLLGGAVGGAALKGAGGLVGRAAPKTAVKASNLLIKHKTAINVGSIGVFGGLAAKEDYDYNKEMKAEGISAPLRREALATHITKQGLAFVGISKGIKHGITKGLPIKAGSVKVPTAKGEATVWRGVFAEEGRSAQPLIGVSGKKLTVGTPKVKGDLKITDSYVPVSPVETKILASSKNLKRMGFSDTDISKVKTGTKLMSITEHQPSKFTKKKFIKEVKTLTPEGVGAVIKHTQKNEKIVQQVYGSFTARPQMSPKYQRVSGDIDIQLLVGKKEAESFSKSLVPILKKTGNKARLNKQKPSLIEVQGKDKKWHHAVDIHSIEDSELVAEGAFGFRFAQKPIKIEKITSMRLSEQGLRKGAGSLTYKESKIGPAEHRLKDVGDFYATQDSLVESMKMSPISFLKQGKISKGKGLLKDWKKTHKDYDWDGYLADSNIKVELLKPTRVRPISPSTSINIKSPSISTRISPSTSPSISPSISPSLSPSPSISPSISPSPSPSISPSISPSLSPSPSISPSISPSPSPSISPSISPSPSPSISLSLKPSITAAPIIPLFKLPKSSRTESFKSDFFPKSKRKKKYTPTLTASVFKLKAKKKDIFGIKSGLGIRPAII